MSSLIKSTRESFIQGLMELAAQDPRHVLVSADSIKAARATVFAEKYPDRVYEVGIAEQNAVALAAGLASAGLIPYVVTYAGFLTMRACEQMRTFVAYPGLPVRLVGLNGGLLGGEREGVTHQFYEDLAITRAIPGMTVLSPADADQTGQATLQSAAVKGPVYLRLGSGREPVAYAEPRPFRLEQAQIVRNDGCDAAIFATGFIMDRALAAAALLKGKGIGCQVVDVHTLKPLDTATIAAVLGQVRAAVTVEDHNIIGGLGSAVCETAAEFCPRPVRRIGLRDVFGRSGLPGELLDYYHIGVADIVNAVEAQLKAMPGTTDCFTNT